MQQYLVAGLVLAALVLFLLTWRNKVETNKRRSKIEAEIWDREHKKKEAIRRPAEIKIAKERLEQSIKAGFGIYDPMREQRAREKGYAEAERRLAIMEAEIQQRIDREAAEEERQAAALYEAKQRELQAQALAARTKQLEIQIQNAFYTWLATFHMMPPNPPYADGLIAEFMNSNYWPLPQDVGLLRNSQHPFVTRCIRCANSFPARFIPTVR